MIFLAKVNSFVGVEGRKRGFRVKVSNKRETEDDAKIE